MPTIVTLIREFQGLKLPEGPAADLFERALQALLEAEGPPAIPIPGISGKVRTAIARSPRGRALYLCHCWETLGWTCLLLDLAPVVMGRPVFLKNATGAGPGRVVTDYQSQKFQKRIVAACSALDLRAPAEPSRLCSILDFARVFLAWTPMAGSPPALKGDLDNYLKNVFDGLQRARIVPNDRTIAALGCVRAQLPPASETLEDRLLANLLKVRAKHPKMNRRTLAKTAGVSQRQCKYLLDLAKARDAGTETPKANAGDLRPLPPQPAVLTRPKARSPALEAKDGASAVVSGTDSADDAAFFGTQSQPSQAPAGAPSQPAVAQDGAQPAQEDPESSRIAPVAAQTAGLVDQNRPRHRR
jgi:hypothetical protein